MSIHVALHHRTHYRYDRLVSLGPQIVRLPALATTTPWPGIRLAQGSSTRVTRAEAPPVNGWRWMTLAVATALAIGAVIANMP